MCVLPLHLIAREEDCRPSSPRAPRVLLLGLCQLRPISWLVLLCPTVRSGELNPDADDARALERRDQDPGLAHLRFLFVEYTGQPRYRAIVDIYRRTMFISFTPFFAPGPSHNSDTTAGKAHGSPRA